MNKSSITKPFWLLLSILLFTLSLSILWMGMRSVMDIGGFCASGGPYVIQTECPEGIPALMSVAPLVMIISMFMYMGFAPFAGAVILPWSAIFLSLGYNFLQYALRPPVGEGIVWGWMISAITFILMGVLPLLGLSVVKRIKSPFQKATQNNPSVDTGGELWTLVIIHAIGIGAGVYCALWIFSALT